MIYWNEKFEQVLYIEYLTKEVEQISLCSWGGNMPHNFASFLDKDLNLPWLSCILFASSIVSSYNYNSSLCPWK